MTVLISGETGTGKEPGPRAAHVCPATPALVKPDQVALPARSSSELSGHEKALTVR
jgi:transcriptional regulator with GAF, ATPase, and Fis domain